MAHGIAGEAHGADGKARRAAGVAHAARARSTTCGVPRAKITENYFPLTISGLAKSIYHSLSLCVTLYHSSGIVKIDFVPLRCQVDDNASAAETCNVEVKQKKYGSARIFKNNVVHLSVTCCRQETHATKGNETNDNYAAKQTDTDGH